MTGQPGGGAPTPQDQPDAPEPGQAPPSPDSTAPPEPGAEPGAEPAAPVSDATGESAADAAGAGAAGAGATASGADTPPPPTSPVEGTTGPTGGGTNWLPWAVGIAIVAIIAIFLLRPGGPLNTASATPEPSPSPSAEASPSASPEASPSEEPSPSPNPPIASGLVFGASPECPGRPFCLIALEETYGLEFKEFVPLDSGGPLTVEALKSGRAQVGLLFTSDPAIVINEFVLLEDDQQAIALADNIVPVLRQDVLDANAGVADVLNAVMETLSQEELTALNVAVTVDQKPTADVARDWIAEQDFPTDGGFSGDVTVGSTNFYEQEILAEIFAQVLEANGLTVERKFQLGPREIVFPALESGEIDLLAEYAATALEYVNGGAGEATTDPAETTEALRVALEPKGLVALDYAEATDQNGIVVTKEIAEQYGLTRISDLGNPAP